MFRGDFFERWFKDELVWFWRSKVKATAAFCSSHACECGISWMHWRFFSNECDISRMPTGFSLNLVQIIRVEDQLICFLEAEGHYILIFLNVISYGHFLMVLFSIFIVTKPIKKTQLKHYWDVAFMKGETAVTFDLQNLISSIILKINWNYVWNLNRFFRCFERGCCSISI